MGRTTGQRANWTTNNYSHTHSRNDQTTNTGRRTNWTTNNHSHSRNDQTTNNGRRTNWTTNNHNHNHNDQKPNHKHHDAGMESSGPDLSCDEAVMPQLCGRSISRWSIAYHRWWRRIITKPTT